MSCSIACRYYTERTLAWCLNNKIIVVLSLLSFSLFVSTLALSSQKHNLQRRLNEAKDCGTEDKTEATTTEITTTEISATETTTTDTTTTDTAITDTTTTDTTTTEITSTTTTKKPDEAGKAFFEGNHRIRKRFVGF